MPLARRLQRILMRWTAAVPPVLTVASPRVDVRSCRRLLEGDRPTLSGQRDPDATGLQTHIQSPAISLQPPPPLETGWPVRSTRVRLGHKPPGVGR
jgi:hypothetical protein